MKPGYEIYYVNRPERVNYGEIAVHNYHRINKVGFYYLSGELLKIWNREASSLIAIFRVKPIEASPASRAGRVDWDSF
jgi:hypothetical protein